MSIVTETFARKPFQVEAIRVTEANMEEVAQWCGGEIRELNGKRYIQVDVQHALNEKQKRAYAGDHVLQAGNGFKVYTNKAFHHCFDKVAKSHQQQETLFEAPKPAPKIHMPTGYPQPSTR